MGVTHWGAKIVILGPFWTIFGHCRQFWTPKKEKIFFVPTIEFPRNFYCLLMCHTLGSQNGHFGPFWTMFGHFLAILDPKNKKKKIDPTIEFPMNFYCLL